MQASIYTDEQQQALERYEAALAQQLAAKPKRLSHSLSVARTAEELAERYGQDVFSARVAGTLHDWCKAQSSDEQIAQARELELSFDVELELLAPVIHGPLAALELPKIFPELTPEVLSAIEHHTVASSTMSELDKLIYVADLIEPERPSTPSIEALRAKLGYVSLDELFFDAMKISLAYVIETGRYLWPRALEVYNAYIEANKR